ncbi:MAG: protoporphyrinogen oxidase [Candidatus Acidiferrales bacterium]
MAGPTQATIIGGGISGLACAYRLRQLGVSATLFEAEDRIGGLIGSVDRDGFLFDCGPQSFQGTEILLDLIRELGLEGELQTADPRAPRYVLVHGHLQEIPMSPTALLTSSLLSAGSRWKVISDALWRTRPPANDESVASFVRRKFGHEILEYLVSPFVSGVYAGDPEKLSLRSAFPSLEEWERKYGSILRGAMKSRPAKESGPIPLCSFRRGVAALTRALAEKLGEGVRTCSRVTGLRRDDHPEGAVYSLRIARAGREETVSGRAIVMATPAYIAAQLLGPLSLPLAHALSGIAYAPVAVIAAAYYRRQLVRPMNGFGFLVPRSEKLRTLGTIWNSSLFTGRAREGMLVLTSFAGGASDPEIVGKSEDEIAGIVQNENARVLNITGPPVTAAVWRYPRALPQYNLGHGHIVETIRAGLREIPGLFFSGNYLEGPSLGKCVEQGFRTAESVRDYLNAEPKGASTAASAGSSE